MARIPEKGPGIFSSRTFHGLNRRSDLIGGREIRASTVRSDRQRSERRTVAAKAPADGFDALIERAACLLVISLIETDDGRAQRFMQQAIDCMVGAARSPFFGGTKTTVSYEGIDVVRDEVFDRVRDYLITWGYHI